MSQEEKRALEIYFFLIIQYIRKENDKAIEDLKNFLYCFSFMHNYSPYFLYITCLENIEIIEKIPTHGEILIASTIKTDRLNFSFKTFKPYYTRKLTKMQLRQKQFSKEHIMLLPKITARGFHIHLLTFLQNFAILSKNIPIKEQIHVKRRDA